MTQEFASKLNELQLTETKLDRQRQPISKSIRTSQLGINYSGLIAAAEDFLTVLRNELEPHFPRFVSNLQSRD